MKQRVGSEPGGGKSALRWGIERRLEFIDFRLFWEGRINRADLTRYFGISTPRASADLRRYQELALDDIVYDKSAKCYLATLFFDPVYDVQDSNRYLAQPRSIADGTLEVGEVWIADLPSFQVVSTPSRTIAPHTLKAVLDAIRNRQALKGSLSVDIDTRSAMAVDHAPCARFRRFPLARARLLSRAGGLPRFRLRPHPEGRRDQAP